MDINRDTRIIDLTCGEFEDWLREIVSNPKAPQVSNTRKYVYGLVGIQSLFGCSKSTAERLKNGKIKDAVTQNNRKIVVDAEKAMQLFNA